MKKTILILIIFLFSIIAVLAQENHDSAIKNGKSLIDSKISCDKLSNEQLEAIGDYYMEQMHPGESHEIMDKMMGGEGSESLKQMHINMARRLYCNDNIYIGYGMMSGGMMGNGMMNSYNTPNYGMMGNYGSYTFFNFLYALLLIGLIILVILVITRLIRDLSKKQK